jgi:hypothetical protein
VIAPSFPENAEGRGFVISTHHWSPGPSKDKASPLMSSIAIDNVVYC